MTQPRFAVSEFSTMPLTFEEDLAAYAAGGAEGIGLAEAKLPEGRDDETLAQLRDSGLKATICLPAVLSILPVGLSPEPLEPEALAVKGTPGLSLFLQLPGPLNPVRAFDLFAATAQRLAEGLGGELRDRSRSAVSRQSLEHLRDEVQQYELRLRLPRST